MRCLRCLVLACSMLSHTGSKGASSSRHEAVGWTLLGWTLLGCPRSTFIKHHRPGELRVLAFLQELDFEKFPWLREVTGNTVHEQYRGILGLINKYSGEVVETSGGKRPGSASDCFIETERAADPSTQRAMLSYRHRHRHQSLTQFLSSIVMPVTDSMRKFCKRSVERLSEMHCGIDASL